MELGQSCTVSAEAGQRWNHTQVQLRAGHRYRLSATGTWCDRGEPWGPDGHPGDRLVFRLTGWMRRGRRLPWFALLGALDEDPHTIFRIGSQVEVSPPRDGELTCFANDVACMYGNNSGALALTIERVR